MPGSKKLFLGFYLCFCLTAAQAQYRIDNWTADNGLPQNSVYGIVQTRDGYLWLATLDGLARFDGVRFTVFNKSNSPGIVNNRFTALFEDERGNLWAGTEESGIVRYHNGRFSNYPAGKGARIDWIGDDGNGNAMTLIPEWQAIHFADGEFSPFDLQTNFLAAPRGGDKHNVRAWCPLDEITSFFGCYVNGRRLMFSPAQSEPEYKVRAAVQDADSNFWLLTDSRELVRVENGKTVRVFNAHDGLPKYPLDFIAGAKISLVSWDGQDSLWLTDLKTMSSELLVKKTANAPPETGDLYPPYVEFDNVFKSSYQDDEGNLWFGTLRAGLYRARKQVVTAFSTAEGLTDNNVYPLYENDDGTLLVGTTRGVFNLQRGRFAPIESPRNSPVLAFGRDPAGRIIFSTYGGLYVLEANRSMPFLRGKIPTGNSVPGAIHAIHSDPENALWIGAEDGLMRFKDEVLTKFTTENGLAGNDVKVITEARTGGLWIGTYGGLSRLNNGHLTSWTENDGLPSRTVRALYEDADGTLWIGSYDGGLARFKDGKFTHYNSKIGLYNDGAFQILEDEQRNFWVSSNHGIYRVKKDELNEYADGKRKTITSTAYGKSDGMLNAECNGGRSPGGVKTRDGRLWFPTQDGVAMIDPREIKINSQPPPVVIETIKIDNVLSETPELAGVSDITIEPHQQNFEITYTALSFINSENLRFKYKLEGLDDDWIDAGNRRMAYFSHVPPGNYTFRVIAANSDNVWNEQGAAIKIVVIPAFYQTRWFVVLCAFAVALVTFLIYRRRLNEIRRRQLAQEEFSRRLINAHESERRRVAAELHDSIGQSLAMIKNSAVFGGQTVGSLEQAKEHLAEISSASAQAISEVREIAYNLRPFMLDRLGLTKAISSLLNKVSDNSALKIVSEIENIDGLFESEAEISVYRIIQECLNNILKHSEASKVIVKIAKSERGVSIKISDNGRGFDVKKSESNGRDGFGLFGMTERVRILGGTFEVVSGAGEGTAIDIEIWRHK